MGGGRACSLVRNNVAFFSFYVSRGTLGHYDALRVVENEKPCFRAMRSTWGIGSRCVLSLVSSLSSLLFLSSLSLFLALLSVFGRFVFFCSFFS